MSGRWLAYKQKRLHIYVSLYLVYTFCMSSLCASCSIIINLTPLYFPPLYEAIAYKFKWYVLFTFQTIFLDGVSLVFLYLNNNTMSPQVTKKLLYFNWFRTCTYFSATTLSMQLLAYLCCQCFVFLLSNSYKCVKKTTFQLQFS